MSEHSRKIHPTGAAAVAFVACTMVASEAVALEPLETFMRSARTHHLDNREAHAQAVQRDEEAETNLFKLAPVLTATAQYTHNQYAGIARVPNGTGGMQSITISAENQMDGTFSASVPLVDVAQWERIGASNRTKEAAFAHEAATALDVAKLVARAYYNVVGYEAVLTASYESLKAAEQNLAYVKARQGAGFASELDAKRAMAEVERNRQTVADAVYQVAVARRELETETGIAPSEGAPPLRASLEPEAPLEKWMSTRYETLPAVKSAAADVRAAEKNASVAMLALAPTLTANASERLTNAAGFGQQPYYTIGVTGTWRLDATALPNASSLRAATDAAMVREQRVRWQLRDSLYSSWHEVQSLIVKCRAAQAQVDASNLAATLSKQRYDAGTATFLDVITAQRDAFSAEVSRIQADASLQLARVTLRLTAAASPDAIATVAGGAR